MPLRNLFRRQTEAPTLRDRAAGLSARLAISTRTPEPGTSAAGPATTDLATACDQAVIDWRAIQPRSRAEEWDDIVVPEPLRWYGAGNVVAAAGIALLWLVPRG